MATLTREPVDGIVLATEPPFRLGSAQVRPALRQISWDDRHRTLEPRVMQVLVALARAGGEIVGRDELVARCWDGRIVGENALQRVISLLRALAADSGAFEIETITKVGYRLKAPTAEGADSAGEQESTSSNAPVSRRALFAGALALAVTGGAGAWLLLPSAARREAERLHAASLAVQRRDSESGINQVVDLLERAVAADPDFAPGWADLAEARRHMLSHFAEPEHEARIAVIRRDASRALALDPGNRQALVTLALLKPPFRHWLEVERDLRGTLARVPDEPQLRQRLGDLLCDTGRIRAAAAEYRWLYQREPLVPGNALLVARSLWYRGSVSAADRMLVRAQALAPSNPYVWLARFHFLLLNARADEALALSRLSTVGLGGHSPLNQDVALATARALIGGSPAERAVAVDTILAARKTGRVSSFIAIPYLIALGAQEAAWEAIYVYYLGKRDALSGERLPLPIVAWRRTDILFSPTLAPLRADPRFPKLTLALGLDRYWRDTGTRPDRV